MPKHYKMTFTEDRETFKTLVIPANDLVSAYIEIQLRFPNAEITEAIEGNTISNGWAESIAKYMLENATIGEVDKFVTYLDDEKRERFAKASMDEWHNVCAKAKRAV